MGSNKIITIGRQFGAKGRSIGKKLADELGIAFYDNELISEAARASGMPERLLASIGEATTTSLMYSLVMNARSKDRFSSGKSVEQLAYEAQIDSVRNVAELGPCVIVGRAADYILAREHDILSIFISAPLKDRIEHVAERDGISADEAKAKIFSLDKARSAFYNGIANRKWGAAANYNLCFNSATVSEEYAVKWILDYAKEYWGLSDDLKLD